MTVPYTFASSSGSIPLSYLDSNFSTAITMGNTAVQLGDTITTFNNVTLASPTITTPNMSGVTISSGNATVTSLTATTVTASGNVQMASANGGQLAGLRNRFINGGMQVAQRGTATLTAAYQFGSCDRWQFICSGGTGISGTIYQNNITSYSTGYAGGVQAASWTTGQFFAQQRIEAKNVQDLNSQTITVSCKVFQNTGGTRSWTISLVKPTALDNWTSQTSIGSVVAGSSATGVVTTISASFTLGATDASNGLAVLIFDNAANTVVSKIYLVGDAQLELGSVATPFEQRPYGMELALCQRYTLVLAQNVFFGSGNLRTGGTISYGIIPTPVTMRAAPAATPNTGTVYVGDTATNYTSLGISGLASNVIYCGPSFASAAGTIAQPFLMLNSASAVVLSAEL